MARKPIKPRSTADVTPKQHRAAPQGRTRNSRKRSNTADESGHGVGSLQPVLIIGGNSGKRAKRVAVSPEPPHSPSPAISRALSTAAEGTLPFNFTAMSTDILQQLLAELERRTTQSPVNESQPPARGQTPIPRRYLSYSAFNLDAENDTPEPSDSLPHDSIILYYAHSPTLENDTPDILESLLDDGILLYYAVSLTQGTFMNLWH